MKHQTVDRVMWIAIAVALAAAALASVLAVLASRADAAYAYPGVSVVDTEQSCPHIDNGLPQCYTWIRINGVLRRGSPGDYFSEAQGGYVAVLCSEARWHGASSGDDYNVDYDGGVVFGKHFHWRMVTNNGYCWSPSGPKWPGTPWPAKPNRAPL